MYVCVYNVYTHTHTHNTRVHCYKMLFGFCLNLSPNDTNMRRNNKNVTNGIIESISFTSIVPVD